MKGSADRERVVYSLGETEGEETIGVLSSEQHCLVAKGGLTVI